MSKLAGFDRVSAITDEEIKQFIGQKLSCSDSEIRFGPNNIKGPYFKETLITEDEILEHKSFSLFEAGVEHFPIKKVEIFARKELDYDSYWDSFGAEFYIKSPDIMVVHYKGAAFELTKKN